ncbi:outer membrane protein assembly factor BamE [Candidatus Profftia tarda]|uniref:Outer membrane protein assembly factor BamE n=1 Tax=Candidatus Profftia tarda TaxID=1177216 RepID=A0A8E4EXU3_9ENTR|nr:outer membrane protein assembly factor BamE [Candidatus Profftia tarda]CAD6507214.1 Outer membrane protein assembly factor BamE [Candidatus Profftia tarda]
MFYKFLITIVVVTLTIGCSTVEKFVYRPNINQGNYLIPDDVSKICIGMTEQEVTYILGVPMLKDLFGANTWFYVFRQQLGYMGWTQEILTLNFDRNGVLNNIENTKNISDSHKE